MPRCVALLRGLAVAVCLAIPCSVVVAQNAGRRPDVTALPVNPVTEAAFDRFLTRHMGTWRHNLEKSKYVRSAAPAKPIDGHIYRRAQGRSMSNITKDSDNVQVLDGRPYPGPGGGTVARVVTDEFTMEFVVVGRDGKFVQRSRSVASADGSVKTNTVHVLNEKGEEVIDRVVI